MARTAERSGPLDRLKSEANGFAGALAQRAVSSARNYVGDAAERLTEYAESSGGPGLAAAVTGAKGLAEGKSPAKALLGAGTEGLKSVLGGKGKGKGGSQKLKVTNIVESIDVGVPVRVAYDQWTQFSQFPTFMKKVENVEQAEDEKLNWKAQVFWSHRTWEATIIDQRPDERIIWQSKGEKGHVDGAVTFHELGPNLTRIVMVLEYHPQGLFEKTGNLWRAQGRRARLELKHFQRHVTTSTLLHPDEIEGWRGVIEDSEVVKDHETAVQEEEERDSSESDDDRSADDQADDQADDEADDEQPDDEQADDEEPDEEQSADDQADNDEPDERDDEEQPEERPARRRTSRSSRSGQSAGTGRKSSSRRGQTAREGSRK